MVTQGLIRRAILVVGAVGGLSLGLAPVALAASPPYSVSVTQFSTAVTGVAPPGATGVTVNLLRNGTDNNGKVVENTIDSFKATPSSSSGSWGGNFASHQFLLGDDEVQVNYSGTIANDPPTAPSTTAPSPTQITIGESGSTFIAGSDQSDTSFDPVNKTVQVPDLDGGFWIDYQGKTINCSGATSWCEATYNRDDATPPTTTESVAGFSVSVAGGSPQSTAANGVDVSSSLAPEATLTFSSPVTSSQSIEVTASVVIDQYNAGVAFTTNDQGGTQINVSVPGPQISVQDPLNAGAPSTQTPQSVGVGTLGAGPGQTGLPSCTAYLVFDEVTCSNLTPGSYTLTDGSSSQTLTVPAATQYPNQPAFITGSTSGGDLYQELFVPEEAGASVPGLAAGQTVTLSQSGRMLDTLTVDSLQFTSNSPLGDLLNSANTTVTGSCTAALFVDDNESDLCSSTGAIPTPNKLAAGGFNTATSEYEGDGAGLGHTAVFLPQFALQQPFGGFLFTPFVVAAQLRYNDPITGSTNPTTGEPGVNAANTPPPTTGPSPIPASTASTDQAVFSYAPLGSSTFTTLGNANVSGGLQLPPTLPIGWYDGNWKVIDAAGNSSSSDFAFYNEGSTVSTLTPPVCTVKVSGGGLKKATITAVANKKATKGKKKPTKAKKPKKPTIPTTTFSCTATSGARVALWLQRGSTVVADGSGTVKNGKVKIVITGTTIKTGTYQLVEVIDLNGHSTEADQTLTLKK